MEKLIEEFEDKCKKARIGAGDHNSSTKRHRSESYGQFIAYYDVLKKLRAYNESLSRMSL